MECCGSVQSGCRYMRLGGEATQYAPQRETALTRRALWVRYCHPGWVGWEGLVGSGGGGAKRKFEGCGLGRLGESGGGS